MSPIEMVSKYADVLEKVNNRMQQFEKTIRPWNFVLHVQEGIEHIHEITAKSRSMTGFTNQAIDVIAMLLLACDYIAKDKHEQTDLDETEVAPH